MNMYHWQRIMVTISLVCCLVAASCMTAAAAYFYDKEGTQAGSSAWNRPLLEMDVALNGHTLLVTVTPLENNVFGSSGTMYLKVGAYQSYGTNHAQQRVTADVTSSVTFRDNLDDYSANTYPKDFYVRYEPYEGGWAWAGPIRVSHHYPEIQLSSPRHGASGLSYNTQDFEWQAVKDAAGTPYYRIVVSTNSSFSGFSESSNRCISSSTCWTARIRSTTYSGFNLDPAERYYWKVRAGRGDSTDGVGGLWSDTRIFGTRAKPDAAPDFRWNSPSSYSNQEGSFTVSGRASDDDRLKKVTIALVDRNGDNQNIIAYSTSSPSSTSRSISKTINPENYGLAEGDLSIGIWIVDADGNVGYQNANQAVSSRSITWNKAVEAQNPSSGAFTQPQAGASLFGAISLAANASDADGLNKVSVVFTHNGTPLVLCEDGTATPCSGTDGSWTQQAIDPQEYGVTADGTVELGLWVKDERGKAALADSLSFQWAAAPLNHASSGRFTRPGAEASLMGTMTVSAEAADRDGLRKVSVVFTGYGSPLVLCEDGTSTPCSGTEGSWTQQEVDPQEYDVSEAGTLELGLWVKDEAGETALAATQLVRWEPPVVKIPHEWRCDGYNYEQRIPIQGIDLPEVTEFVVTDQMGTAIVNVQATVDTDTLQQLRDEEDFEWQKFFYVCVQKGTVECLPDSTYCDRFTVSGFGDPRYPLHFFAQVGDTMGYIDVNTGLTTLESVEVLHQRGTIQQGQTIRQRLSLEDFTRPVTAYLKWPGSDLDLRITSPSGEVFTPDSPRTAEFYAGPIDEYYVIESDEEGEWSLEIIGVEVDDGGEPYELTVTIGDMETPPVIVTPTPDPGAPIPEPGTLILIGIGLPALFGLAKRRKQRRR